MLNLYTYIGSFSLTDVIFFSALIILLILIVVMIYIVKINLTPEETVNTILTNNDPVPPIIDEEYSNNEYSDDEECAIIDMASLTKKIEDSNKDEFMTLSEYEEEQEKTAIISYEELVNKSKKIIPSNITYVEEKEIAPDYKVKQIDVKSLENKQVSTVSVNISEEEAFLQSLQSLSNALKN